MLDRSHSMQPHWADATAALEKIVTVYERQHRFGLLVLPTPGGCEVGAVAVPVAAGRSSAIIAELARSKPGGMTPLGQGLKVAASHFADKPSDAPRAVVLVTDGIETCDTQDIPPNAAAALRLAGIKTHVIAIGSGNPQLDAIAVQGGTQHASVIDNAGQLAESMGEILDLCCGNGVLDPGESCDTATDPELPGACPTQCDDKDPCTVDRVSCQGGCAHWPVLGVGDDGCCRGDREARHDPDCQRVCGNGALDGNELCDIAIPSGSPGACSCDDNDPCTKDEPLDCYRFCIHTPRTADPGIADGCCPLAGLPSFVDIDCRSQAPAPATNTVDATLVPASPGCALAAARPGPAAPSWIALVLLLAARRRARRSRARYRARRSRARYRAPSTIRSARRRGSAAPHSS